MAHIEEKPLFFRLKREWLAYIYLLPMLAVLLLLTIYPISLTFYYSLTKNGPLAQAGQPANVWVGLLNYVSIFTQNAGLTGTLVFNSFFWATASVAIFIVAGLGLAAILNQPLRGKTIYRTLILFPWAMPAFITILTWNDMLNFNSGIINAILALFNIPPVQWHTGSFASVWGGLLLMNLWLSFPYYTVVFLAAMQAIPKDLYESAEIDGASILYKFTHITVPYIGSTVGFVALMGWLFTFNNFYPIYLVTAGGPQHLTSIFVVQVYQYAFTYSPPSYAIAATYTVLDFLIMLVVAIPAIKYTRLSEGWFR